MVQRSYPFRLGPAIAGLVIGLLLGLTPLAESSVLSGKAILTLGLGLGTTYFSIGLLVALLPAWPAVDRRRLAGFGFGFLVGALYGVPGAFFTMVPYPLEADAAAYWREFADGGIRAFALTLGFSGLTGGVCGLFRKGRPATE